MSADRESLLVLRGVVLVGHGGVPRDCPSELVLKLKRLEGQRRAAGTALSSEEQEVDTRIRRWPRTATTDPYRYGLEAVAGALRPHLDGALFAVAYNEFCAPTLDEAVEDLIKQGATQIIVVTTMFTPGGAHSEVEIPDTLERLRARHPEVELRYAWPFDLHRIGTMLADEVKRFS